MNKKEIEGAKVQETARPALNSEWIWVSTEVWTKHMLAALGNGVRGSKWHSLIDKVYNMRTLRAAWKKVAANRGAAGIDRMSIERFKARVDYYLEELEQQLREGTYQPNSVRRVYIPKSKGKTRPLGIATVKDRVVQTALKLTLEPIFENEFLPVSFGFRPERNSKDALRVVDKAIKDGYTWAVDADLQSYFDTIPKQPLLNLVEEKVSDSRLLELLKKLLNQEIVEDMRQWTPIAGAVQGSVISSLMSNLYLHGLDKLTSKMGIEYARFADDFVALCRTQQEAENVLKQIKQWVEGNGLQLHPDKTHVGNCMEKGQGFEFLGYRFECGQRSVRPKSRKALRDRIREKTGRTRSGSLEDIIKELNPVLKGWYEYFKHARQSTFRDVDGFVRRRLRAILRKREQRPGFGRAIRDHTRWTNAFFAKHGLFTMHEADGLARQSR